MIALASSDLGAGKSTAYLYLDTLSAQLHCSADGLLHSSSEGDSVLQIVSDLLSYQLSVDVGVLYLNDVDSNALADLLLDALAELIDLSAALTDNHTGLSAVNVYSNLLSAVLTGKTLDLNLGNACVNALVSGVLGSSVEVLHDILTNVVVLNQSVAESALICKPAGIPILYHTDSKSVRINFLAHSLPPLSA